MQTVSILKDGHTHGISSLNFDASGLVSGSSDDHPA